LGYTLDEAPRSNAVWLYVDEQKKDADPDWIKPFATKVAAESWLGRQHRRGGIWKYPVTE
jgi:hypothetical protein